MADLVMQSGDSPASFTHRVGTLAIGRSEENTVSINDASLSRRQCEIRETPEGYWLTDLGSRNGTFVDGRKVERALLAPGSKIGVGNWEILVQGIDAESLSLRIGPAAPAQVGSPACQAAVTDFSVWRRSGRWHWAMWVAAMVMAAGMGYFFWGTDSVGFGPERGDRARPHGGAPTSKMPSGDLSESGRPTSQEDEPGPNEAASPRLEEVEIAAVRERARVAGLLEGLRDRLHVGKLAGDAILLSEAADSAGKLYGELSGTSLEPEAAALVSEIQNAQRESSESDPQDGLALYGLARGFSEQGEYVLARRFCQELVARFPESELAQKARGLDEEIRDRLSLNLSGKEDRSGSGN